MTLPETHPFSSLNCYPDWGYFPKCIFNAGSPYHHSGIYKSSGYFCFERERSLNLFSYIPVLNIAVGINRLYDACSYKNQTRTVLLILRGVCDILLGPLNLIIDLIVTIARVIIAKCSCYNVSYNQAHVLENSSTPQDPYESKTMST